MGSARHCEHFRSGVDPLSPPLGGGAKGGERLPSHILTHASRTLDVAHGDFIQGGHWCDAVIAIEFFRKLRYGWMTLGGGSVE